MCPTKPKQKQKHRGGHVADRGESDADDYAHAASESDADDYAHAAAAVVDSCSWRDEAIHGGSLKLVDLDAGTNGWASPPGDLFLLRSRTYLSSNKKTKTPSGPWLLSPAGFDWLKSPSKLDHVLSRPDNRVMHALRKSQSQGHSLKTFLLAVNLQVPGRDHHSAVFYFSTDEPIQSGSLLHRFIDGDDHFRNSRFKIVNRIVKGPWIVKAAVGNYAACLLGKALTCRYHRGENYLEIDVDIGSSAIANAVLKLALGYVAAVTVDMGFVVEAQAEEELPERLFGAVRVCQIEMSAATVVDRVDTASLRKVKGGSGGCCNQLSQSKVGIEKSDGGDDDDDDHHH